MEKRFPPSKKRLREARRQGNTPKSQYLTQTAVCLTLLAASALVLGFTWVRSELLLKYLLTEGLSEPYVASRRCISEALKVVFVVLGFGAFTAVVVEVGQVGVFLEPSLASPRIERLNPLAGCKKIASSLKEVPLILVRLAAVVSALLPYLYYAASQCGGFAAGGSASLAYALGHALNMLLIGFAVLSMFAYADLLLKRRAWLRSAGMSLEDLRREHKEEEGDPHYRAERRARHRELSFEDMVKRVRSSKVLIVAPAGGDR